LCHVAQRADRQAASPLIAEGSKICQALVKKGLGFRSPAHPKRLFAEVKQHPRRRPLIPTLSGGFEFSLKKLSRGFPTTEAHHKTRAEKAPYRNHIRKR